MKLCILLLFLTVSCGYPQASPKFSFTGDTDYTQQKMKTWIRTIGNETRIDLYESHNKKFMIYCGGSSEFNYNVFMSNFYTDTFSMVGIEF